jgi:hypothetical protein
VFAPLVLLQVFDHLSAFRTRVLTPQVAATLVCDDVTPRRERLAADVARDVGRGQHSRFVVLENVSVNDETFLFQAIYFT